jgi:hypothetical protein
MFAKPVFVLHQPARNEDRTMCHRLQPKPTEPAPRATSVRRTHASWCMEPLRLFCAFVPKEATDVKLLRPETWWRNSTSRRTSQGRRTTPKGSQTASSKANDRRSPLLTCRVAHCRPPTYKIFFSRKVSCVDRDYVLENRQLFCRHRSPLASCLFSYWVDSVCP